jgi:HK97 family phage portal protein
VAGTSALEELARQRLGVGSSRVVTPEQAMRNSAVWASLRLRANLVSSMPVDVYRWVGDVRVSVPAPPALVTPGSLFAGGKPVTAREWLFATQVDLDRSGNAFGLITERTGLDLPARIDLVPLADVVVKLVKGELQYWIRGTKYPTEQMWHERQYSQAGLPVGLSPLAAAALTLGEYASAQELAMAWFSGTAVPPAHLRNTAKTLQGKEARAAKDMYKATVQAGDILVTGSDWELRPFAAVEASAAFLESRKFGLTDIARFFDVPADLLDAAVSGSSITYANQLQRNLQFLTLSLGPAVSRREDALTELLPAPRFVKLNRGSLLAMDPRTRAEVLQVQINSRQICPSEARALEDRAPYTEDQLAEFDRLFGARQVPTSTTGVPA